MWIFGYGSLMWDGWEEQFACRQNVSARLWGYVRSFTKASVRNWGTRDAPGPTLNIAASESGYCDGIAFEFDDSRENDVFGYLQKREGHGFAQISGEVFAGEVGVFTATTYLYVGKNILTGKSDAEIGAMALRAFGTEGSGADYIANCKKQLDSLGIVDESVEAIWQALGPAISNY